MKYIDSVKQQVVSYMILILICLASLEVTRYLASDYTPLVITSDRICWFISVTLAHFFVTPLCIERFKESAFSKPFMGFELIKKDQHKK